MFLSFNSFSRSGMRHDLYIEKCSADTGYVYSSVFNIFKASSHLSLDYRIESLERHILISYVYWVLLLIC